MNASSTSSVILSSVSSFGASGLVILGAVLGIAVALLVFRFGWKKVANATGSPSYMDSYKGANLGAVSGAILRSKGNNSADNWGM